MHINLLLDPEKIKKNNRVSAIVEQSCDGRSIQSRGLLHSDDVDEAIHFCW